MTYYNTTHVSGNTLKNYETKAEKQAARILNLFTPGVMLTRHETYQKLNEVDTPETSVCGRLRDLVKANKLIKLPGTVRGEFGRPVHQWTSIETITINNT